MLEPGDQIHHYIVEEPVGGGGMARVYRVRHAILGHALALKVLDPFWVDKPQVRRRFLAEGRIQALVRHPAIVLVTDAVVDASRGIAGLVMEYVEGPNLEQVLERNPGPASPELVRDVMLPVLEGMHHVHQEGVVHRDLKPANVLMSRDAAGRWHPRVVDFGVAHVADADLLPPSPHRATRSGARLGTPAFMAPGQVRGEAADPRWDVFALGVILFELLTGAHPFEGEDDEATMKAVECGQIADVRSHRPDLPEPLARVVDQALAPLIEDRFRTCAAFAAALEGALAHSAAHTPSPAAPEPPAPTQIPPAGSEPAALLMGRKDRWSLQQEVITVGAGPGAGIELPSGGGLEPVHCHLERVQGSWFLEDRSASGSRVNGARVHRVQLAHGDLIRLGHAVLRFHWPHPGPLAAPAPSPAAPAAPRGPCLEIRGQRHPIPALGSLVVGRSPEAEICVDDPGLSPKHFKITAQGRDVAIEDLGSTAGTRVDGQRVRFRRLRGGETIEAGGVRFHFHRR